MFAFTANDQWQPGIGDPTFVGCLTVFAYFSACILCWKAALKARHLGSAGFWSRENLFWLMFTGFLLLLGINKQLDFQTWFTLFGKHLAQEEGWYEERRIFQLLFIVSIAIGGAVVFTLFCWLTRTASRRHPLAVLGGVFLGCFVIIRAASFHYVDQMLGLQFGVFRANWILELGGILCIAIAAARSWRAPTVRPTAGAGTRQ